MKRKREENPQIAPIRTDRAERLEGEAAKKKNTRRENPIFAPIAADEAPNKNRQIFSLLNDFVFKCVFGQEKHEHLAICLLNALLKKSGTAKILSLEFLNPFNLKEAAEQKASVVDVKVRDGENRTYIIEVQVCKDKFFVPRTVYYLARLYSGQLLVGEDYSKLKPSTGISILDFDLFEESVEMHNIFEFRDLTGSMCLPNTMVLHYIELTKFSRDKPAHLRTPFEKWQGERKPFSDAKDFCEVILIQTSSEKFSIYAAFE